MKKEMVDSSFTAGFRARWSRIAIYLVLAAAILPAAALQAGILTFDGPPSGSNYAINQTYNLTHTWTQGPFQVAQGTKIASTTDLQNYNAEWGPENNSYYQWTVYNGQNGSYYWRCRAHYFNTSNNTSSWDELHAGVFDTP